MMNRPPQREFDIAAIDEDHVKGVAFNIVFMVWRRRTLAEPYRAGARLVAQLGAKFPEGVGVMQVVEVDAVPPDSDARKVFVEFLKQEIIKHYSVTHEGTGFKAASVRAIVSGVQTLARPTFEHSVHSSVAAAARWAAAQNKRIGRNDDPAAIERVFQALRKIHVERYPNPTK